MKVWSLMLGSMLVFLTHAAVANDVTQQQAYRALQLRDYATAVTYFRELADQGDLDGQEKMGLLYARGWGVPQDFTQAAAWYRKAAARNDPIAKINLGFFYLNGQGVPKDSKRAIAWFQDANYPEADYYIGQIYKEGNGVPRDNTRAIVFLGNAAKGGYAPAQRNLGDMYAEGSAIPKDDAKAAAWYRKSIAQGDVGAELKLGLLIVNGRSKPQDVVAGYALISNIGALPAQNPAVTADAAQARRSVIQRMSAAQIAAGDMLAMDMQRVGTLAALTRRIPLTEADTACGSPGAPVRVKIDAKSALYWCGAPADEGQITTQLSVIAMSPSPLELQIVDVDDANNVDSKKMVERILISAKLRKIRNVVFVEDRN